MKGPRYFFAARTKVLYHDTSSRNHAIACVNGMDVVVKESDLNVIVLPTDSESAWRIATF
jgi:hypothetical protein